MKKDAQEITDFFGNIHYMYLRTFMRFFGLWPYQTYTQKVTRLSIIIAICISITFGEVYKMITVLNDFDETIDCLPNIFVGIFVLQNLIGILFKLQKVELCFKKMMEDWKSLTSEAEIRILDEYTQFGKKFGMGYFVYMIITTFIFIVQPLITYRNRKNLTMELVDTIPLQVAYGVNEETYYYSIFIHSCISLYTHISIISAINYIYTTTIQHVCGLFAIIGYRLQNVGITSNVTTDINIIKSEDKNYWIVLDCLRKHIKAIEFADLINSIFAITILFCLGLDMLSLTVAGIQVVMHLEENMDDCAKYFAISAAILNNMFLLSWQAQRLMDHSNIPYESAYHASWYCTSTRCKKLLSLIMIRCTSPSKITAGNIFTISIQTFSEAVRTSMSYFTVLRSMQ